jgi:2-methylaconitate cis-trans-isomerase PrpF
MKVKCTIVRGGTSKGVLIHRDELPSDPKTRDETILAIFGSPDRRQIDGLGGSDVLTSKLAIVGAPTRDDADIDYTFGQVGIETPYVDYGGYCGNILSAVASYAVDEKFVSVDRTSAKVRVHVTNTGRIVVAEVPVANGRAAEEGAARIFGVPGSGAPIVLNFADTVGSITGKVFPTGRARDRVSVPSVGEIEVSIVDCGNPMIFARLESFRVSVDESADALDARRDLISALEEMRARLAREFDITMPDGSVSEHIPIVALVAPPQDYRSYGSNELITKESCDLVSREFFCGRVHKAYGVGETVCTSFAALLPETIVNSAAGSPCQQNRRIRIGHPSGVIDSEVSLKQVGGSVGADAILVVRTARRIMDGVVHVREGIESASRG